MKDVTAEFRIKMKPGCNCPALLSEMNRLGPDGCRQERSRLVDALKENAKKYTWGEKVTSAIAAMRTTLVWRIDVLDPYGSMLDEAICRTDPTPVGS